MVFISILHPFGYGADHEEQLGRAVRRRIIRRSAIGGEAARPAGGLGER